MARNWFRTTGDGGWSWLVVASAFVIQVMGGGSHYAQGVYVSLFLDEFKASKSMTALVGSIFGACLMMSAPLSAKCAERFGNRKTAFGATILATLGLVLSAFANSIIFMYFTFSIMAGLGLGLSYMPGIKAVGDHFQEKRAIAMGLACAGVGMGSFLFPPIINSLIQNLGLKGTLITHGVITFISLGLASLALISCERTSGKTHLVEDAERAQDAPEVLIQGRQQGRSLWYDSRFTLLCANQVFGWLACIIVIMDLAPYGKTELGLESHHASMLLSTSGALNVLGRIVGGFVIVAFHRYFSALTYYSVLNVMLVLSTFAIPFVDSYLGLLVLSGFFGLGLSCYSAVLADMVADMFGKEAIAFSFGYFVLFQGVGALIGAPLSGMLHDATHTYKYSFGLAGTFYIVGVVLLLAVRIRDDIIKKKGFLLAPSTNALLSARTITSIISSTINLARQNSSAVVNEKEVPLLESSPIAILDPAGSKKDISSSNSGDFSLHPVWIVGGGEGEAIEVPKMELIQVHSGNDADQHGSKTPLLSDTSLDLENLKPSPSPAADVQQEPSIHGSNCSLWSSQNPVSVTGYEEEGEVAPLSSSLRSSLCIEPRSRKVSIMSAPDADVLLEEPLTAQEVYAAEEIPMLKPEKAPMPNGEDEDGDGEESELTSLAPDEIEELLEPEDFLPASTNITPLPPPMSPLAASYNSYCNSPPQVLQFPLGTWQGSAMSVACDSAPRSPVPEMVITNKWTSATGTPARDVTSGRASLSSSVPRGDVVSGWTLRQEELSAALLKQQERSLAADDLDVEQAPLLGEIKIPTELLKPPSSSASSKRSSVIMVNKQGDKTPWHGDESNLDYQPLNGGGDDPVSESSDDSMFMDSNQSTIQSCIFEADTELRSLKRLGIDVKQALKE